MTDRIIFDSSVWIDIGRGIKKTISVATPFIEKNNVVIADIICAEVLRGAKSEKDYNNLINLFENFDILTTSWLEVARLGFLTSRKGFNPPLADLYIANCAIENNISVLTKDKHFLSITSIKKFRVVTF